MRTFSVAPLRGLMGIVIIHALGACSGSDTGPGDEPRSDAGPAVDAGAPGNGDPDAGGPAGGRDGGSTVVDAGGPPIMPPPDRVPAPFDAAFLWDTIEFTGVVDLEADVREIPDAMPARSVLLREVAATAGLDGVTGGGEGHGVGVGFVDVDGDGYDDLFLATGRTGSGQNVRPSLHLNQKDGTFIDISDREGTGGSSIAEILNGADTYSISAADYDADGDLDLYVTMHPTDKLLQNDGNGGFTDVTTVAGAGGPSSARGLPGRGTASKIGAWGDYDGDGWLDLAVASSTFEEESRTPNGYLLRNLGNGTFEDVTDETSFVVSAEGNPCAVFWSDFDNDGDQDLWVWNDRGNSRTNRVLLRNTNGTFDNVADDLGATGDHGNPMGIDGADVNRDGYLDYYISDIRGSPLYLGSATGDFRNVTNQAGVGGDFGWGLGFEDLNLDGWPDIFVAQEDNLPYVTFTHNGAVDSEGIPSFSRSDWTHSRILDSGDAHNVAVAFADYDRNGTIDMVTATGDLSNVNLFRNDTPVGDNRFLEVRIGRVPGTGAVGGISARVVVKTGDLIQFRDISGGSSRASQNGVGVRFGLGAWTGAEWVAVLWPDGRELSAINVPGNRVVTLSAP